MASYATIDDVQARTTHTFTSDELRVLPALLEDAGAIIDAYNAKAPEAAKLTVSCRMVIRAMSTGDATNAWNVPTGAAQGSMAAGGYSQSWSVAQGGSVGELYLTKGDRALLGGSNKIGSYSPVQELAPQLDPLCLGVGNYD